MLCLFKVGSGASLRTRDSRRFRFSIFDSKNDKNVFILHRWTMMTNIPSSSCIRISSSDDEKHNDENDIEAQEHHVETGSFPPMNRGIPIGGGCPVFHNNARSSSPLSSSTIQDMQDTLNNSIQEMHHMDLLDAYDDDDDDDDDHKNNKKQDLDQADDVEQPQRQLKSAIRKKSRFSQLSDDVSMDFVCSNDKKREDEKDLQEEFDANRNKNKELSRQRRSSMTLNESIDSIRWKEHGLMEEIKEEDDSPSVVPQRPANYRDFLKAQRSMRLSNSQNLNFQEGEDASYTADESSQQTPEQQNPEDARRLFQSMRVLAPKMTEAKDKAAVENMIYSLEKRIKKLDVDGTFKDKNTLQAPWYSVPIQRQRWGDDQVIPESNFSNLFFDLFFIGAIYNIQGMLLTAQAGDWLRAIFYFIGIFGPIFVTWETDVYYHSRYCVVDYAHRFFDVVRFVFVTATVLFIQPLPELKNPQSSVAAFALTMSIFLESILHLLLNVELYHKARGDRVAIQNHTLRKIQGQLMPKSIIYFLATLSAGIFYFVPMDNVPLQGAVWSLTDLPLTLTGLGYVGNITFTLLRKLRAASANSDIRKTFVPNNIDYVIQRYNDWFLLLLGEAVMAMVEITDSERDYFVASMGALTTIVIHTLKFESEPGQAHGHALWRNMSNATCFSFLTQVLSTGLILFGVSYKILLTDDRIGLSGFFCTLYVCLSLAWVLITLELMVMTHKGLTKTWQRLFHEDEDGLQVLYWPLVLLTLFKLTLFSFLMTIPVWTDNVNIALIWSFIVVFLVAITRIVGWAFVFREDEIKEFVSKAKKRLRSKVSFVSDSDNLDRRNSRSILSGRTSSEMKMTASSRIVGGVLRRLSRKVVSRKSSFISSAGSDYDIESSYRDSSFSSRESFNSTRKRAEVYDEMFDAVVLIDLKGFIITVNETALSVFRYDSKNDLIGHNVSMLVGGGDAKHHDAYLKAFHKKEKNQSQIGKQRILKAKRKDESEFPCIIGIKRSQNNKYLVGYIRDMTSIADLLGGSHKILGDENSGSLSSDEDDFVVSNVGAIDSRYKKHLRRVLDDKTFDCIVVADFYGVIQGVNATFVNEFLYRSKDELFGENLSVLIANPYIAKNHDGYLAKFREKGEQTSQIMGKQRALEAKRRDGSVFKCIVGVQAIEGVDLMVGYIRNLDTVE